MKIDLRNVPVTWINLDTHTENAKNITEHLDSLGFTNHYRTAGVIDDTPGQGPYGIRKGHYIGVGRAMMNAWSTIKDKLPGLVLEDDVVASEDFQPVIEVPDNVDAVYLGVSHAGQVEAKDIGGGWARVKNMLAAHAILYCSERYMNAVEQMTNHCLFEECVPFDLGTAKLQNDFFVITPHKPFFYQSDSRQSTTKWEDLTKRPLTILPQDFRNQNNTVDAVRF